jgi:hypothetical protein
MATKKRASRKQRERMDSPRNTSGSGKMIDEKSVKALAKQGLSLLRFGAYEWGKLEETRHGGTRFSLNFPHNIARSARPNSIVLIGLEGKGAHLSIGLVRTIQAISTFESRVMFDLVHPIKPRFLTALLRKVTDASLRTGVAKLASSEEDFQAVSPKLGERLIQHLAVVPENGPALQRLIAHINQPKHFNNAKPLQRDAITLAIKAFGLGDGATAISLPGDDTALASVRLHEDAVIEHEARWLPGWHLSNSDLTGRAVFTRQSDTLHVFTANKRPLEELFGVDLIYLNEPRGALVMVQYKMMEPQVRKHRSPELWMDSFEGPGEQEWGVSINQQFKDELARMKRFDQDLSPNGPYRLNSGAFFFKLVKRYASTNTAGILLSLGHLEQMLAEGVATGPRAGLRVGYRKLKGHYLRSDAFVELVRSGYIGTRGATTEHLQSLINLTLTGGRAVVAALQTVITSHGTGRSIRSEHPEE